MKTTLLLAILAVFGCATYDVPPEPYPEPDREPPPRERVARPRAVAAADIGLPSSWWRDPVLAEPLALSTEQYQRLESLGENQDEIDRLEEDATRATRELRESLMAKTTTAADIVAAGKRLRDLRDTLLDRQIAMLAAQREILTYAQWDTLQDALANEWRERRLEGGGRRGMGGRGRGGFGGRRPGGVW